MIKMSMSSVIGGHSTCISVYDGAMREVRRHQARDTLDQLPKAQRQRLSHIDFNLYFLGELRRADVVERFGTGPAGATRDIAQYREIASENLYLDNTTKVYRPSRTFTPLFDHEPQRVLMALSRGFGGGVGDAQPMVRCEFPAALSLPKMDVLAPISQAIHRGKAVRLTYTSITSGKSVRELVPLALVDNGIRWHIRAFDRKRQQFSDFVLTRMEEPTILEDSAVLKEETAESDVQWSRIIELEMVPHPDYRRPEAVLMDYDMIDGVLHVKVRAANAGYLLRRWSVDCSPNHSLKGPEYALWLRDPLALYGSTNAQLAPGYVDPRGDKASPT